MWALGAEERLGPAGEPQEEFAKQLKPNVVFFIEGESGGSHSNLDQEPSVS